MKTITTSAAINKELAAINESKNETLVKRTKSNTETVKFIAGAFIVLSILTVLALSGAFSLY